jgi:molecular chaperone IbpA
MTKITSFDLTPFYRNTVGMDRLFDRIVNQIDSAASSNYPPYDIVKVRDDHYEIRIAAAGFRQGEIQVEFHEGRLTVHGAHQQDQASEEVEYLYHGISNREWTRTFALADYVEVKSAQITDGVLRIKLERVVPDALKPRKIEISYEPAQ